MRAHLPPGGADGGGSGHCLLRTMTTAPALTAPPSSVEMSRICQPPNSYRSMFSGSTVAPPGNCASCLRPFYARFLCRDHRRAPRRASAAHDQVAIFLSTYACRRRLYQARCFSSLLRRLAAARHAASMLDEASRIRRAYMPISRLPRDIFSPTPATARISRQCSAAFTRDYAERRRISAGAPILVISHCATLTLLLE